MRKKIICLVVFFSLLQFACERKQQQISFDTHAPKVVEARGYTVPQDSMAPPKVVPVPGVKSIVARKPKVINLKSNVFPVGDPRIVQAGKPRIYTPGQDTFQLPKVIPAIADSPFSAQPPEVVLAKDPQVQENNPESFMSFKQLQGLKSNNIWSNIIQDKSGNLWFGTLGGGVTKYDGRSFTHYSTPQGLSDDIVHCILEDKSGNLWFGTGNGDLNKYDGESFTHYSIGYRGGSIIEDKKGNLWLGALGGLSKYDGKSFTIYTTAQGLSDNGVEAILEDKNGNLWFSTYGGGLTKFDGRSFTIYTAGQGLSSDKITGFFEDKNGILWIGTWDGGINKFDGKSFTHYTTAQGLSADKVGMILEDKNDNLWICTDDKGINKFDGKSFTHFGIDQGLSNRIQSILEDKSGNLWIGTWEEGLTKYVGNSFTHYTTAQGLSSNFVRCIREDKKANLWFGTWGGVTKYDGRSFTHFGIDQGLRRNVNSLLEDKSDNLWFGTWGAGLYRYDGKSFTNYTTAQGLNSDFLSYIFEDKSGNLWIGTWGQGVVKYDGRSFTNYGAAQGLTNKDITCISEDKSGNLWFGTRGGGVSKYDGRSFTNYSIANGLNDATVNSILEDKSNNLWFGTSNGGVNKFDGKFFTQYTTAQGLCNNSVTGILEDKIGDLWFSTPNGISRMQLSKATLNNNAGTSLFKNYLFSDGFLGVGTDQIFNNTLGQDSKGNIWIGMNDRLTCFHPEGDLPDTIAPDIQLTGISLFNENIKWLNVEKKKDTSLLLSNGVRLHDFKFSGLSKWYYIPEQLELVYDNNYLTFQFIGITTQRPRDVKYQYLLEGLDKNWSSITDKPEASYSDLPNGNYTFKVKAVNSEGYWSNELVYDFTIFPPWWKTKWAYGLYALLFVASVWAFIQFRSRRLRRANQTLEEKVTHRTAQLKKSLEELKSTQTQLVQREKMASLGELTAGIAHEIQNPLNFVNNFSEINAELITELEKEIDEGNSQEAKIIAKDLRENEQKINHHGKRADAIVKGMLQHSRTSTGEKEPTDINALVDEYLRLSYHGMRAKNKAFNAILETHFDENSGKINIVPQDIGRVLLNLFNNAFYSVSEKKKSSSQTPEGGTKNPRHEYEPTVTVTTSLNPPSGGRGAWLEISIHDNGLGIPQKVLDKIYQPFFTTKPSGEGTGLGLSLSYDIITKGHGGELKVATKEGEYAEFIIQLPLKNTI